jgi:hypothetical protein
MYYHASTNDIELQRKKIEKETKRLRDKLAKRRGKEEGKNSL